MVFIDFIKSHAQHWC